MWRNIVGLSKTVDFTPDESFIWNEDEEMEALHFVSTAGLLKEVIKLGSEILSDVLPEDLISVVNYATIKHFSPCVIGETIVIGVRVTGVEGNNIRFYGIITKDNKKIAEIEYTRVIVSKNYLRRKAIEETT
ncbi:MAG: thioesterase [Thermosipho sp. (in: Bacteria)]|nr:thioesterase [Thermosipho sp. (in: thermotogales)]